MPVFRGLIFVEDHHAESDLRQALASLAARGASASVVTADALLAMRLRREGIDARLTNDGLPLDAVHARDRAALDGVAAAFGRPDAIERCLDYTLIPAFVRAIRNVTAVDDVLRGSRDAAPARVVLVGGGALVAAARLVARHRAIATERFGSIAGRTAQGVARLRAGRATKWVNTGFRALVLEPGFILLLFLKGLWKRAAGARPPHPATDPLIVVGDRFTRDVVERMRGVSQPIILAGATQPGRTLFASEPGLVPLETFAEPLDLLRGVGAVIDAAGRAWSLATERAHGLRFTAAGASYWPLVRWTVCAHLVAWVPLLRHLESLTGRAARAYPGARLLTSTDVTAYNRVLVEAARRSGIESTSVQHGITGQPNGHSVVHVDRLATWGAATERWYRERAPQRATFVVTGNPRFDALAARVPHPKSGPPFTIVVCTGFVSDFSVAAAEYENLAMIDAVVAWAERNPGARVIHKMHPGEEPEYYAQAARALGWNPLTLTSIRDLHLYGVLEKSDVLVASYSTTVLESVALGTPAIVLDAVFRFRLLSLDRIPGITIAYSIEELEQQLAARLSSPQTRAATPRSSPALVDYIGELDGLAAERIAALIRTDPERAEASRPQGPYSGLEDRRAR